MASLTVHRQAEDPLLGPEALGLLMELVSVVVLIGGFRRFSALLLDVCKGLPCFVLAEHGTQSLSVGPCRTGGGSPLATRTRISPNEVADQNERMCAVCEGWFCGICICDESLTNGGRAPQNYCEQSGLRNTTRTVAPNWRVAVSSPSSTSDVGRHQVPSPLLRSCDRSLRYPACGGRCHNSLPEPAASSRRTSN